MPGQTVYDHLRSYSIGIFSTMAATWVRMELEPVLESRIPFGLFFISSMLTAWLAGTGPAVVAAVLSVLAAAHFIIEPQDSLFLTDTSDIVALTIYLAVTLAAILMFHQRSQQLRLAEESATAISKLNTKLREADHRKDDFLALLAHELRNPLTPIQTAIDLMRADTMPVIQEQALLTIRRQMCQLVRLVNDLLDASRYVHGTLNVHMNPCDLREAIELAIETNKSMFEEKHHQFHCDIPNEPMMVNGDLPRIAQSISNLLHNAGKFTHREGHVRLSATSTEATVSIRIDDDGIGIPEELRSRIFELFTQVNSSRSRREGGLGIGLALVRELAHLHGGTVAVESAGVGRGSTFTLQLPRLIAHEVPDCSPATATHSTLEPVNTEPRPLPKILLIDDNVDGNQMLQMLFELHGYEFRSAGNGIDGIRLAHDFRPDVILLDIGMPGMDGYEVARTLRQREACRATTIIAVSGWDGEEYRARSFAAGIDLHIAKPFHPSELMQLINDNVANGSTHDHGMTVTEFQRP